MRAPLLAVLLVLPALAVAPTAAAACSGTPLEYATCMARETGATVGSLACAVHKSAALAVIAVYEQYVGPMPAFVDLERCVVDGSHGSA